MKTRHFFNPTEIIFAATDACNLHCPHCFVSRNPEKLNIDAAKKFISSCKGTSIEKIGFSGGEPFLYVDFLTEITKFAVENDFMFDQIMTNGDWWKDESDLAEKLQKIYDVKYDGKIGVSWDSFHNQYSQRIITFIKAVQELFGEDSINVQYVKNEEDKSNLHQLITETCENLKVPLYELDQTFQSEDSRGWKSKKWFKDDFCEGPGNIFFVQPDGNIAPCCGFANEDEKLFIGNINQTYDEVMQNAEANQLVKICFEKGLLKEIKGLKRKGIKIPGKTKDICTACDFLCKLK